MNNITKKIIFGIILLVIGLFIFYSYPIIKNRYFQEETAENEELDEDIIETEKYGEEANKETSSDIQKEENPDDPEIKKLLEEENAEEEKAANEIEEEDSYIEITAKDCQSNCKKYDDEDDLKYCREFCGLKTEKETSSDCTDREGLEIDYCFKDLAIDKRDYSICEKIRDLGIQKTCRNRITEDIIDSQKN